VDEVHGVNEETGRYISFIEEQTKKNPKCKIVGFTATPYRSDGYIYGKGKLFTHPTYERGLKFFIDRKYLVPPICKQPDHQIDLSKLRILRGEYRQDDIDAQALNAGMARDQVIDALNRSQGRKKIVWQCSSINHAILIKDILRQEGEASETLHSKMDTPERLTAQFNFEIGAARHLTFVSIVSEGYDYPPVDCIVLMRPTRSPGIMVQTVGRGLRPSPGKEDCLVLDYAGVVATLGPLEAPAIGKKSRGGEKIEQTQKACPECRTYVSPRALKCPTCGFDWPKLEATKNALTAAEDLDFLKKQSQEIEVRDVRLSVHVSKAGSLCYKISYFPNGIFLEPLDEYFNVDLGFSMRRFILRAVELGFDVKDNPHETAASKITKIPKRVEFKMDNKYPRIKRLIF
jgi:DNA repair protein RadD